MLTVGDIAKWMDEWYPPHEAAEWDRVGLIVGSREAPVKKVMLAVDPVEVTGRQAIDMGADMIITHHPLYLRGTSFVSEDNAKGRLVANLIRNGVALFNAHTNADVMPGGVAEALAELVGLEDTVPMEVTGETKSGALTGYGRIGDLEQSVTLAQFASHVARVLPAGPNGLLVGGDPDALVRKVAVSGGSGDSFLGLANRLGADVFITADLRHHPASEHLEEGEAALICGSHFATEWPWLPHLATQLRHQASQVGDTLEVVVSHAVTEPWTMHLATEG